MATPEAFAPVAITSRNGLDESVHFGAVVCLAPDGSIVAAVGDPSVIVYPRSSNKPMQAVAMVRAGLQLPPDLLALVCASHDGTPMHTSAAERILATVGLDPSALGNTPDYPLDLDARYEVVRHGGRPAPLFMNCSGKHAGMIATCVRNGWEHADGAYLAVDHPLQLGITGVIEELAGEDMTAIGVDGCGAPAHAFSLVGAARAIQAIATGAAGAAGDEVYAAMTSAPEMVGGVTQPLTAFTRHVPGFVGKEGAEGVFIAALPDGRAVALKISDGAERAAPAVMVAALRALGVDVADVAPRVTRPIKGHGRTVGEVRAVAP